MRCLVVLLTFVAALAVSTAEDQDDCMPKFVPGQKPHMHLHHNECCKIPDYLPETLKAKMETCFEKYPRPPKPTGPPPAGASGPPPEVKKHYTCVSDCIFTEANLLTADKQLDTDAVMKMFVSEDKDLGPVMKSAVSKCLTSYKNDIDQSLECKSGAAEFKMCVSRHVFLNCPEALWESSTECTELKEKTTRCTNMPVMLGKKHGHGPPH